MEAVARPHLVTIRICRDCDDTAIYFFPGVISKDVREGFRRSSMLAKVDRKIGSAVVGGVVLGSVEVPAVEAADIWTGGGYNGRSSFLIRIVSLAIRLLPACKWL